MKIIGTKMNINDYEAGLRLGSWAMRNDKIFDVWSLISKESPDFLIGYQEAIRCVQFVEVA